MPNIRKAVVCLSLFCFSFHICLAQQTRLLLPFGHTSDINSAKFSNDGTLVLTSGADSAAIVWDVATGNQLYDLRGHRHDVQSVRSSHDDQYLATASSDSTVIIWAEKTGDLLQVLPHPDSVLHAFFLEANNELIAETSDSIYSWRLQGNTWLLRTRVKGIIYMFNENEYLYSNETAVYLYNGKNQAAQRISIQHPSTPMNLYMSPRQYILSGEDSGAIKLYDKRNGRFIKKIALSASNENLQFPAFNVEETMMFYKPVFRQTDSYGDVVWNTDESLSVVQLQTGKVIKRTVAPGSHVFPLGKDSLLITGSENQSFIYSVSKNKLLNELRGSWAQKNKASNAVVSVDKQVAILHRLNDSSTSLLQTTALESFFLADDSVLQTRFETELFSGAFTWKFREGMFQLVKENLKLTNEHRVNSNYPTKGYFPSIGVQFHNASSNQYDVQVGSKYCRLIRRQDGQLVYADSSGDVKELKIHEGSNTFAVISKKNTARLFSLASGQALFNPSTLADASSSMGGTRFVSTPVQTNFLQRYFEVNGFWAPKIHFYYNQSGSHFYEIRGGHTNSGYIFSFMNVWTTDGKFVGKFYRVKGFGEYAVAFENDKLIVLDGEYRKILLTVPLQQAYQRAIVFEKKLLLQYKFGADVLDIPSGKILQSIAGSRFLGTSIYDSLGKQFIELTPQKIIFYNSKLEVVRQVKATNLPFGSSMQFLNNNQLLLIASARYLSILNIKAGKYFHLFFPDNDNWIVLDENGNFDGTEDARKKLYLTCGTEVVNLEQVKDQLWVPNLAERIIAGETVNARKLADMNICGFTPEVINTSTDADTYRFKIQPRSGGLGETVLLVNGIEAKRYPINTLKKIGNAYELVVPKAGLNNMLIAGQENPVTVKAYTADNGISSRGLILLADKRKQSAAPANLYAVMVGVSDYKGEGLDLKYAAKDATDLSSAISHAAKKMLNTDGKEHVFMYNLTTSRDHYLQPEKNSIKKVLEEIGKKAKANDILLVFFAGHGMMEANHKKFYFLTADASAASAVESIADVGISTAELTDWMKPQNIPAQKRILIFDACNSGQAIKDFVTMGSTGQDYLAARNDDEAQQIKAIDKLNEKSGLFILSASSSNQSAYEMGRYAQGLLTYSLLKAIKQQPDILDDGKYLDLSRWFSAAEKTVSEVSKENGARQDPQIVSNTNFNIGIVDDEVMGKVVLAAEKPLFAASNFQNNDRDIADDDLELSRAINSQLQNIASRGTESVIVYNQTMHIKDAFTLTGGYDINADVVSVNINIKQNKILKGRFKVVGSAGNLKALGADIVNQAAALVRTF